MKNCKLTLTTIILMFSIFTQSFAIGSSELILKCKALIKTTENPVKEYVIESGQEERVLESLQAQFCLGYISGFFDNHPKEYCLPSGLNAYQVAKIYIKYVEENPEIMHKDSNITFPSAMAKHFLCTN